MRMGAIPTVPAAVASHRLKPAQTAGIQSEASRGRECLDAMSTIAYQRLTHCSINEVLRTGAMEARTSLMRPRGGERGGPRLVLDLGNRPAAPVLAGRDPRDDNGTLKTVALTRCTDMLHLRPNCECCDRDLPPESSLARICSFECTFCADCAEARLHGRCPNCEGELVARPRRPAARLDRFPPSTQRVFKPEGCGQVTQAGPALHAGPA